MNQDLITGIILGVCFYAFVAFIKGFMRHIITPKYRRLHQHIYCFECEIEMPVKENIETGELHCANCGLIHTNEYTD